LAEPARRLGSGRLLVSRPDAAWLPPGGRADVVLAGGAETPPEPTCVVRLLVTCDGALLTRQRTDGRGLDLPSATVDGQPVTECLRRLQEDTVGPGASARLLGYVRNVVDTADGAYPWPRPLAHFSVWHCDLEGAHRVAGEWLAHEEAAVTLSERHWWPLAAELLGR
jgi:hypothetical protein